MKYLVAILLLPTLIVYAQALVISEVMSNPIGDDSGREWIEVYNDGQSNVDVSSIAVSIKGATPVVASSVSGGSILQPGAYAIIASVVSGVTKFMQDYPMYTGVLLKNSMSLVNTGITSLELKVGGVSASVVQSYVAAKEGYTYSLVGSTFVTGNPTPGSENQGASTDQMSSSLSTTTENQAVITQMSLPSSDIVLYVPQEKVIVAGAESLFTVSAMTKGGKIIEGLSCAWAFGDGGRATGTSTLYRYVYSGRYISQVECSNVYVSGTARISVRVVGPEITISEVKYGKYGSYVDISNPNPYDLDFSQWKLSLDGALFTFPKNTLVAANAVTHFSSVAMGFASTTISSSTVVSVLFPSLEEVVRYKAKSEELPKEGTVQVVAARSSQAVKNKNTSTVSKPNTTKQTEVASTSYIVIRQEDMVKQAQTGKDKRIASFIKSLFWK